MTNVQNMASEIAAMVDEATSREQAIQEIVQYLRFVLPDLAGIALDNAVTDYEVERSLANDVREALKTPVDDEE